MSKHIGTCFGQRIVWNSTQKIHKKFNQEFRASKTKYISWFNISKAFASVYNGRTYAQVVRKSSHQPQGHSANQRYNKRGTRIVTVPQGNANAAFVTSPKVSIKPKPSRPVVMASSAGLKPKVQVQHACDKSSDRLYIPIKNRFQALENLHTNLFENQENTPTGLDDMVATSAASRAEKIRILQCHKAKNIENSFSAVKTPAFVPNMQIRYLAVLLKVTKLS